ncbi:MAG TPA: hypothetical protein VMH39_02010 [Gemmatimonadaceae bacterium]|nr:hypothetical protein [Gemmatimonadaceae bacterium]
MRRVVHFRATLMLFAVAACERPRGEAANSVSVTAGGATRDTLGPAASAVTEYWPSYLGSMLLVGTEVPTRATLIPSDSSAAAVAEPPKPARAFLIGRDRRVQVALVTPALPSSDGCWTGSIQSGGAPLRPWTAGFVADSIHPVALDSIAGLKKVDSIYFSAEATRLASIIPGDSTDEFFGLPFVVETLWHFGIPGDTDILIATLQRQINQEAMPLQERTLIVAEQDSSTSGSFVATYAERSSGEEETIETREVLGVMMTGQPAQPTIILARDFGDGVSYALIERTASRQWHVGWSSAKRKCSS